MSETIETIVTLTKNADQDKYEDDDYRDMFNELRTGKGLRPFVKMIDSVYSAAQWSKFDRGISPSTRTMRNELRRAVGLPELPLTVAESIAHVSPDAEVVSVTDAETPDRLILAFSGDEAKTISVNGEIAVGPGVTIVARQASAKPRRKYYRACLPVEFKAKIADSGYTVSELIEIGLDTV